MIKFVVRDFGQDTTVVTKLIGLEPTLSYSFGPVPGSLGEDLLNKWEFQIPLPPIEDMEDQIIELLSVLESQAGGVKKVAGKYKAYIQCEIFYEEELPIIRLSKDTDDRIADLGLSVEFNLYPRI